MHPRGGPRHDGAAVADHFAGEAMALIERGFTVLKFFPAEQSGGIAWLKAVAAPLPGIKFCPTGGIDMRNAGAYLALPNVISVGGSWPAPRELIAAHDFARITALARQTSGIRNQASGIRNRS